MRKAFTCELPHPIFLSSLVFEIFNALASAIEYLKTNGDMFCSLWREPETRGSHWYNICNELLWTLSNDQDDLVMKSETKITLHDETASFIGEQLFNMKHAMENQSA